jgi:anthranilate synthase component 1
MLLSLLFLVLQAGAGLVADSVPESEYEETLNKAAALGRAIDLAEQAFVQPHCQ